MEQKEFYAKNNTRYFLVPIMSLIGLVIAIFTPIQNQKISACILFISVFIVFSLPLLIFRKFLFFKIKVNNIGISKVYKKQIITEIKWESLLEVRAASNPHGFILIFLDYSEDIKTISKKYKTNVYFLVSNKNLEIISLYKEYFRDKITDVSLLGKNSKILF